MTVADPAPLIWVDDLYAAIAVLIIVVGFFLYAALAPME